MEHLTDKVCCCRYCHMIDVTWGDPLLSSWEINFIRNIASWGWRHDYTPKQKAVLKKIYFRQYTHYLHLHPPGLW